MATILNLFAPSKKWNSESSDWNPSPARKINIVTGENPYEVLLEEEKETTMALLKENVNQETARLCR